MKIEIPYYEDNTRISNSAIGWFLKKGPRYLKDMLDGKEEGISGKYLDKGTMIHMYLLQPDEFWDNYEVLDFVVPKVNQQKTLCIEYVQELAVNPLEDNDKLLLNSYNKAYSNSKSNEKKLEEAKQIVDSFGEYISYLKLEKANKTVISFADITMLRRIKENIDNHKKASELLTNQPGLECNNEFHINWEYEKQMYPVSHYQIELRLIIVIEGLH